MRTLKTVCLSLLAFGATLSGAQLLPSAGNLDLLHRGAFMLADPRVQSKVGLSQRQTQAVDSIVKKHSMAQTERLQAAKSDPNEMLAADMAASVQLLRTLNPTQTKALKQVAYRAAGYSALLEPEISKQLALKPTQKDKIASMLQAASEPLMKLEEIIARQMNEDPSKASELRKAYANDLALKRKQKSEVEAASLKVLTPSQRKIWNSLVGTDKPVIMLMAGVDVTPLG